MGWLERHKIEEYIISNLKEKYNQFTITIEYDFFQDEALIYLWNGKRFDNDLFMSIRINHFGYKYKDEILEEVIQAVEKRLNPKPIIKSKITLRKCECCGAILNSLTCEYCGAQYMEV